MERIIKGTFNGQEMDGEDGNIYPVLPNYASKSKLVQGDELKLIITDNGDFIFKQVGPIPRKRVSGFLSKGPEGFVVHCESQSYKVLTASITYFKAKAGDEIILIIPASLEATWAAVDNVIRATESEFEN